MTATKEIPQGLKLALDFAPLVAFFVAYKVGGVYWATGIIIALTILSLIVGYVITGKLAKFPLFSGILITVISCHQGLAAENGAVPPVAAIARQGMRFGQDHLARRAGKPEGQPRSRMLAIGAHVSKSPRR